MAGYHNYSMSNNAVTAYDSGECPISKLPDALGVSMNLIKRAIAELNIRRSSYHHTSKFYNATDFYRIEDFETEEVQLFFARNLKSIAKKQELLKRCARIRLASKLKFEMPARLSARKFRSARMAELFARHGVGSKMQSRAFQILKGQELSESNFLKIVDELR